MRQTVHLFQLLVGAFRQPIWAQRAQEAPLWLLWIGSNEKGKGSYARVLFGNIDGQTGSFNETMDNKSSQFGESCFQTNQFQCNFDLEWWHYPFDTAHSWSLVVIGCHDRGWQHAPIQSTNMHSASPGGWMIQLRHISKWTKTHHLGGWHTTLFGTNTYIQADTLWQWQNITHSTLWLWLEMGYGITIKKAIGK